MKRFSAALGGLRAMAGRGHEGKKRRAKRQMSRLAHVRDLRLETLENRSLLSSVPPYAGPVSNDPPPAAAGTTANWTVLAYIDGDNNLDSFGAFNVNQMESVTYPADGSIKVAVQFDRAAGSSWSETRRALIVHDTNTSTMTSFTGSNYTSIGEADMGVSATLTSFIQWGVANYPANHYVLDIWDHGGGLDGTCWDDTSGHNLTVSQVRQAISNAGTHIDVIGFDACLMGMGEVAHELRSLGDVMVASEELVPGEGMPYDDWLADLAASPSMTASQLGADMVQKYGAYYNPVENDTTLSAVNLANEPALATNLSSFATAAVNCAEWSTITAARNASHNYYGEDYLDLGTFLQYVGTHATNSTLRSTANSAYASYQSAIMQNYSGSAEGGTGLSIYLPAQGGSIRSDYTASNFLFVNDTQWRAFLTAYVVYDPLHNDNFTNRTDLGSASSATSSGSNAGYSGETGEPAQSGTINSAWWKWTAPSAGSLTIDTFGSGFDTYLTLATGSAVNALTVLAQNDDSGSGVQSSITRNVVAGTQYQIAVDGYSSYTGVITLNLAFTPSVTTTVGVTVSPQSVSEDGSANLLYTFTRTGSTSDALTVNIGVAGSNATFGIDYVQSGATTFSGRGGTVVIPSGSSSATVTIDPTADNVVEPDETLVLSVSPGTGYNLGTPGSATGTITNDDKANITINDVTQAEGSPSGTTTFTFTVSLNNAVTSDVTVMYATADGTATTADNDYAATNGTVAFTAGGPLTQMLTVNVNVDGKVEADETFAVNLMNARYGGVIDVTRVEIGDSQGVGTIMNDDAPPTVNVIPVAPNVRLTSVGSVTIQFSGPVVGFDLADLQLTRDSLSVPLSGATLTTTDQQTWTLGNLADITSSIGAYQLTLAASGSGIADVAGNALAAGAITTWQTVTPIPGDFNRDGTVNLVDLNIWKANFGMISGATFEMGDGNHDGAVNLADLNLWKATMGQSIYTPPVASGGVGVEVPQQTDPSTTARQPARIPSNPPAPSTSVPLPLAAMRTAHEAVFSQLGKQSYSVVYDPLDDGATDDVLTALRRNPY
jgi:hypothetical protein